MFPCAEGETCLKRGGAVCVGSCEANDMRTCGKQLGVRYSLSTFLQYLLMNS